MSGNTVFAGPSEICTIPFQLEKAAAEASKPGHLVTVDGSDKLALNDLDGGFGQFLILKERGQGVPNGSITDTFVLDDSVSAYKGRQGLIFRARVATGQVLVKDATPLAYGTGGNLKVGTPATETIVAVARETITTTANDTLVLVEVL